MMGAFGLENFWESTPKLLFKFNARMLAVRPAVPENSSTQKKDVMGTLENFLSQESAATDGLHWGDTLLGDSHSFALPWSGKACGFRQNGLQQRCHPRAHFCPGFAFSQPARL